MLTVDFDRLGIRTGANVIDVGCGAGRHAFEAYRRGADVIALDRDEAELRVVATIFEAMARAGEVPRSARAQTVVGDALSMPYPDESFDCVIASEILEHVSEDDAAIAELIRVLKVGGTLAVSVPRWFPERVCWWLSDEYHANDGGHVRIYRASELRHKIVRGGMRMTHRHHAHALHAPFWWLKCAVGVADADHPAVSAYHKLLVWDLMHRPIITRVIESALNPVVGKSVAMYFVKPQASIATRRAAAI
jgi:SAM-dependent methyltransferase